MAVCNTYNLKWTAAHIERWKDVPFKQITAKQDTKEELKTQIPVLPESLATSKLTFRDLCIASANDAKQHDPTIWCRHAVSNLNVKENSLVVVTDVRDPVELKFLTQFSLDNHMTLVTLRVFRHSVPIPPLDVPSEHALDSLLTDILLYETKCLNQVLVQFPQYAKYA